MTGKFINTDYKDTITSITTGMKDRLDNPYYLFSEKKPTLVKYWNIDIDKSTLDEGSKNISSPTGENSPIMYNIINDMCIYGFSKITVDLEQGEFGVESTSIEGECIILPNTIKPVPNDYFTLMQHDKKLLFKVTGVSDDTLENGSNIYKITYSLDRLDESDITPSQINDEFRMIVNNIGTKYNSVIRSVDYDLITHIEEITSRLKTYYENLFFVDCLQTFIYQYDNILIYDPFLIEFIIKNKILDGMDRNIFVDHQTILSKTFAIDYDRTFLRSIEIGDKNKIKNPTLIADQIKDIGSLMSMRFETYFKLSVAYNNVMLHYPVKTVDEDLLKRIQDNTHYDHESAKEMYNIIISYFNNSQITKDMIDSIFEIDYMANVELFYNIPILIYILESKIITLLK